jgi:hypothetical protein
VLHWEAVITDELVGRDGDHPFVPLIEKQLEGADGVFRTHSEPRIVAWQY